jgi:hypothetical protein
VTFDVPESVPESDLEHVSGSPIESWEVGGGSTLTSPGIHYHRITTFRSPFAEIATAVTQADAMQVLDTQQRISDANANDVATLPALGSPFAAGSADVPAASTDEKDKVRLWTSISSASLQLQAP